MTKVISLMHAVLIIVGLIAGSGGILRSLSQQKSHRQVFRNAFNNHWQDVSDLQVDSSGVFEFNTANTVIQFRSSKEIRLNRPEPMQTLTPELALKIWTPSPTCHNFIRQGGNLKILFRPVSRSDKPNGLLFINRPNTNEYCYQNWNFS
ncbi:hypothetical protein ACKFKG_12410 [Phormidesmis sp. 146-35]